MAAVKKYAGLPDVEEGVEVYETAVPDLTEASTLPTESDVYSEDDDDDDDDENSNFDRHVLNPEAARQRFEPVVVDTRNVNFSDTIDGGRHDYRTRTRTRRRRGAKMIQSRDGTHFDDSETDGEETLPGRLARLKRETAELQAEIDRIENDQGSQDKRKDEDGDSDYEDTVDHQGQQDDLSRGADELSKTLQQVSFKHQKRKGLTLEEEFTLRLDQGFTSAGMKNKNDSTSIQLPQSTISAIATFSDRLTALETALGVSTSTSTSTSSASILPTLETLTAQIETLSSTLSPQLDPHHLTATANSTNHLDLLATKMRHLITESKRLEDARRAATKSFEELLETRDRHAHLLQHTTTTPATSEPARTSRNVNDAPATNGAPTNATTIIKRDDMQSQFTALFLDSQAGKIGALHALLPTISALQPLLPVVLERLRALSVIHTGAADVRSELDGVERRLGVQEIEVRKWREAVERTERSMQEGKGALLENVETLGGMVRGLEGRVRALGR